MWLPVDLLLWVLGILVAAFVLKLVVSLRVAHRAPVWLPAGDGKPGRRSTGPADCETNVTQVLAEDAVPVGKRAGGSRPKHEGKQKRVASELARARGA